MISEKINKVYKRSYRPYYDRRHKQWKVDFTDRASEEGNLQYVASEYARTRARSFPSLPRSAFPAFRKASS